MLRFRKANSGFQVESAASKRELAVQTLLQHVVISAALTMAGRSSRPLAHNPARFARAPAAGPSIPTPPEQTPLFPTMRTGPSTEHRAKRKFQPGIATYFPPTHRSDGDCDNDNIDNTQHKDCRRASKATRRRPYHGSTTVTAPLHAQPARLAPSLPGQVQADLLIVGMKIRKNVAEGYKTHKPPSTLPSSTHTPVSNPTMADFEAKPSRESISDNRQRELLPFCGLHKIGGYAEQPTTNIHLYGGLDATGSPIANPFPLLAESFTQPFSSSPSLNSHLSTASQRQPNSLNPAKRSWQDEDEVSLHSGFFFTNPVNGMGTDLDDVPVSPLSEVPPQSVNMLPSVRQFAQPKSRRLPQRDLPGDEDMELDFENTTKVQGRVAAGSGSDFEEADFLGTEVEMEGL